VDPYRVEHPDEAVRDTQHDPSDWVTKWPVSRKKQKRFGDHANAERPEREEREERGEGEEALGRHVVEFAVERSRLHE
jgi:hypothetical protein